MKGIQWSERDPFSRSISLPVLCSIFLPPFLLNSFPFITVFPSALSHVSLTFFSFFMCKWLFHYFSTLYFFHPLPSTLPLSCVHLFLLLLASHFSLLPTSLRSSFSPLLPLGFWKIVDVASWEWWGLNTERAFPPHTPSSNSCFCLQDLSLETRTSLPFLTQTDTSNTSEDHLMHHLQHLTNWAFSF